jgi:hypothetical protein
MINILNNLTGNFDRENHDSQDMVVRQLPRLTSSLMIFGCVIVEPVGISVFVIKICLM